MHLDTASISRYIAKLVEKGLISGGHGPVTTDAPCGWSRRKRDGSSCPRRIGAAPRPLLGHLLRRPTLLAAGTAAGLRIKEYQPTRDHMNLDIADARVALTCGT